MNNSVSPLPADRIAIEAQIAAKMAEFKILDHRAKHSKFGKNRPMWQSMANQAAQQLEALRAELAAAE